MFQCDAAVDATGAVASVSVQAPLSLYASASPSAAPPLCSRPTFPPQIDENPDPEALGRCFYLAPLPLPPAWGVPERGWEYRAVVQVRNCESESRRRGRGSAGRPSAALRWAVRRAIGAPFNATLPLPAVPSLSLTGPLTAPSHRCPLTAPSHH